MNRLNDRKPSGPASLRALAKKMRATRSEGKGWVTCRNAFDPPAKPQKAKPPVDVMLRPSDRVDRTDIVGQLRREKEARKQALRHKLPPLDDFELRTYLYSYRHSLFHDMLADGYVVAYDELFKLIQNQRSAREEARKKNTKLWNLPLTETDHPKLILIAKYLVLAEVAARNDNYEQVYSKYYEMTQFFVATNDRWLVHHFRGQLFKFAQLVATEEGPHYLTEAYGNLGVVAQENDDMELALSYFLEYHERARDQDLWHVERQRAKGTLFDHACTCLTDVYNTLAERAYPDLRSSLHYYQLAFEVSRDGKETRRMNDQRFLLAEAFEKCNESQTAVQHFEECLEVCKELLDEAGVGKAYKNLAVCYRSLGDMDKSWSCYNELLKVAEDMEDAVGQIIARTDLSALYNRFGLFDKACSHAEKAHGLALGIPNVARMIPAAVYWGLASAHLRYSGFTSLVNHERTEDVVERLLDWKDERRADFDLPIVPKQEIPDGPRREKKRIEAMVRVREKNVKLMKPGERTKSGKKKLVGVQTTLGTVGSRQGRLPLFQLIQS